MERLANFKSVVESVSSTEAQVIEALTSVADMIEQKDVTPKQVSSSGLISVLLKRVKQETNSEILGYAANVLLIFSADGSVEECQVLFNEGAVPVFFEYLEKKPRVSPPAGNRCIIALGNLIADLHGQMINTYPTLIQVLVTEFHQVENLDYKVECAYAMAQFWKHAPADSFDKNKEAIPPIADSLLYADNALLDFLIETLSKLGTQFNDAKTYLQTRVDICARLMNILFTSKDDESVQHTFDLVNILSGGHTAGALFNLGLLDALLSRCMCVKWTEKIWNVISSIAAGQPEHVLVLLNDNAMLKRIQSISTTEPVQYGKIASSIRANPDPRVKELVAHLNVFV